MLALARHAARWGRSALSAVAGRLLLALLVAAVLFALVTLGLAGAYASHRLLGRPPTLDGLPLLRGATWAVLTGLGLRLFVAWVVGSAAWRALRRRRAATGERGTA